MGTIIHCRNLDILKVKQAWLFDEIFDEALNITGFCVLKNSNKTGGGGVAIYVRQNILFRICYDFTSLDSEVLFVSSTKRLP